MSTSTNRDFEYRFETLAGLGGEGGAETYQFHTDSLPQGVNRTDPESYEALSKLALKTASALAKRFGTSIRLEFVVKKD